MTATTSTGIVPRARAILLATVLAITGFGLQASPVEVPRPAELTPEAALALACADTPAFEGWLTDSTSSHPNISTSRTGDVYAWISKVVDDWSCTAYYRYDGIMWALSDTKANFAYGTLIHSTSVSCNWALNSNDYIKANSTSDCPDTDAEYAYRIHLADTTEGSLFEGTLNEDATPDARGDAAFVHSDCVAYYGPSSELYNRAIGTGTGPRPDGGTNCDPYVIDGFNNSVDLTVDGTAPNPPSTPALATASDTGRSSSDHITSDTTPTFTGTAEANATVTLYDGTTQIGSQALTGGATSWSITPTLGAATYTITAKATDAAGNPSAASSGLSVVIDTTAPAPPSIPDLAAASDTGTSSTDNITADTTPTFTGSAEANATVILYEGTTGRGSQDLTGGATAWSITTPALATGAHALTAKATDLAGNTGAASGALPVTISSSGPAANFSATPATPTNLQNLAYTLTFGEPVTGLTASAFAVTGTALGWTVAVGVPTGNAYPVTLSGGGEGTVILTLAANTVTGTATTGPSTPTAAPPITVDRTAPAVAVTTPEANRALSGLVTVEGTATDAQFSSYTLAYGAGTSPTTWTTIGTFTTAVPAGTLGTWSTGSLSGIYTIRLTATDRAGNIAQASRTVILENSRRGDEAYYTRVPYDLGGGWALDIGVANGEARLQRGLFSIPSYGPAQELSLAYSSADADASGRFGVGWSSNLTQHLTFDVAGAVTTWHRADGGREPFGLVAGTWTPARGHHETMSVAGSEVTITTRDQTRYVFESSGAGRLKRIENRFGKALTLDWSTTPATATGESDRNSTITVDAGNSQVSAVADSAGRTWTFGYTATSTGPDLTCVTDPAGQVTRLGYTAHALTSIVRGGATCTIGGSITWKVEYTGGKAVKVIDPRAHADFSDVGSTFTYSGSTTVAAVLKAYSPVERATSTYTLDAAGRVTTLLDPAAETTTWTWDDDSNARVIARPDGGTATLDYDANGNLTREVRQLDSDDPSLGSRSWVITKSTYNATNDLTGRWEATGDADTATTPDQLVTRYAWTGGQLTSVTVNCTSSGTTMPTFSAGCTGSGTHDAETNLVTSYTYTTDGQLETETDPLGRVTRHIYDTHGNETDVIANYVPGQPATAERNVTTTYRYDEGPTPDIGLVTTETDPAGHDTTRAYDVLGRLTREVLPGDASIPALTRTITGYDELDGIIGETEAWTPQGATEVTRTTGHTYDLLGREESVTDPAGVTTSRTHDAAGNVTSETAGGATTIRIYDGMGRIAEETAGGVTTAYTYDGQGNIRTAITDGVETWRTYDLAGRLRTETTDATGLALVTGHTYDRLGRETSTTDPAGVVTTSVYDRAGRLATTIANDVASPAAPDQDVTTTYAYDKAGNQTGVTGPDGKRTTTVFDALDRATATIANDVASPSGPDEDVTTRTWYDRAGTVIATADAGGTVTRTIPNVRGLAATTIANCVDSPPSSPEDCTGTATPTTSVNVTTTTTYDGRGDIEATVLARLDAHEVETRETRDAAGRLIESVVDAGAGRLNLTTSYAYDDAGRQVAVRDPEGTITRTVYDTTGRVTDRYVNCTSEGTPIPAEWEHCSGLGTPDRTDGTYNLHTSYSYDDRGNLIGERGPNGRQTSYGYDDANRLVQRVDNDVTGTPGANEDLVTTYWYDDAGRQVAVQAPTGNRTTFAVTRSIYDDLGRLIKEIRNCEGGTSPELCPGTSPVDADSNLITTYTYDDAGRMVAVTVPDPSATSESASDTVTTRYAYDAVGRLCRVLENASVDLAGLSDPCATPVSGTATASTSTRYSYDSAGNLASMSDANGSTTTYAYDAAGRMTGRTDPDGGTLIWRYDEVGNRTSQRNRTDPVPTESVQWTYDAAGRILTRTADSTVTTYTYDNNGNRRTATTGSLVITATYDRLNRVLTVDDEDPDATADTTYTYSLTSPSWTDPTGSYTATLDAFDRPVAMTDPVSTSGWAWTYRASGQVEDATAGNGNTTTSTHDATGRELTRTTTTGSTTRAAYTWTYNRAGLVLSEASTITGDPSNGTIAYAYDPLGRLTTSGSTGYTWDASTNRTGAGSSTTTFDAANRPTAGTSPTASYQSDEDGQLIERPGQSLTWDHLGRLTSVTTAAGTTAYTYDPLDRLRTVTDPGGAVTRFRYTGLTTSAAQLLDGTGAVSRSIGNGWTGERLLDWVPGTPATDVRYHGTNAHHDTTWLAKDDGSVISSLRYDPWGVPRSAVPQDYTPFRFQGSWHDASTDLAWVVTRWYAPSLGTFISEDTLLGEPRDPDSRHLYAYGAGEPVGRWDPDGRLARPGQGPYYWYWRIVNYIAGEMRTHARGHEFGRWWYATTGPGAWAAAVHNIKVAGQFGEKVHGVVDFKALCKAARDRLGLPRSLVDCSQAQMNPGPWDHKPILKKMVNTEKTFWTPVPDTGRKEMIRFDVWSNIHYGYVGLSHGIPPLLLDLAQRLDGGNNSEADDLSVRLGYLMWTVHRDNLSPATLHNWIRRMMPVYRRLPGVVKSGWS